eukprot:TRINITY_DN8083_c0_g7_i1.p1 TRINITY_DN8083_c0_g7~~TRINITY_DN8083_c0_g7_i1.p1  ORF type:complete len:518 (+),score=114.15 TRINITY_DN8083_c0_g7_i1:224-1555(+)
MTADISQNTTYLRVPSTCFVDYVKTYTVRNQSSTRSYWKRGQGTIVVQTIAFAAESEIICPCGDPGNLTTYSLPYTPTYYTGYHDKPQDPPKPSDCNWEQAVGTDGFVTIRKVNISADNFGPPGYAGWQWNQASSAADEKFTEDTENKMRILKIMLPVVWLCLIPLLLCTGRGVAGKKCDEASLLGSSSHDADGDPHNEVQLQERSVANLDLISVKDTMWRSQFPLTRNPFQPLAFLRNLLNFTLMLIVSLGAAAFVFLVLMFKGPLNMPWFFLGLILISWVLALMYMVIGPSVFMVQPVTVCFDDDVENIRHYCHEYKLLTKPSASDEILTGQPTPYHTLTGVTYTRITSSRYAKSAFHPRGVQVYHVYGVSTDLGNTSLVFLYEITERTADGASASFANFKSFLECRVRKTLPAVSFNDVALYSITGYDVKYDRTFCTPRG